MSSKFNHFFHRASKNVSDFVGSVTAFSMALGLIVVWMIYAAPRHFDGDSQMPVNTITTIVTFLMVFLIQNAQNRESRALHLKIDELIKSSDARNEFARLEQQDDEEVERLAKECQNNPEECS